MTKDFFAEAVRLSTEANPPTFGERRWKSMDREWVKTEIAHARQKELNEQRHVLFPISVVPFERIKAWKNFDADTGKDSAREIREYFVPDFCGWKTDHDAYTKAFERLLKDLRSEKAIGS
jgi:hypothetical protein